MSWQGRAGQGRRVQIVPGSACCVTAVHAWLAGCRIATWFPLTMPRGINTPHATAISQPWACKQADGSNTCQQNNHHSMRGVAHSPIRAKRQHLIRLTTTTPHPINKRPHIPHRPDAGRQALHAAARARGKVDGGGAPTGAVVLRLAGCGREHMAGAACVDRGPAQCMGWLPKVVSPSMLVGGSNAWHTCRKGMAHMQDAPPESTGPAAQMMGRAGLLAAALPSWTCMGRPEAARATASSGRAHPGPECAEWPTLRCGHATPTNTTEYSQSHLALMVPCMLPSACIAASAPDTPGRWPGGCTPEGSRAARKRSSIFAPAQGKQWRGDRRVQRRLTLSSPRRMGHQAVNVGAQLPCIRRSCL